MNHHVVSLTGDSTVSTVLRNLGVGLGHSLLAYKATIRGISKVQVGYQITIS
jgi:adenylosuccinate lyase